MKSNKLHILFAIVCLGLALVFPAPAQGEEDYKAMVDEIGVFFDEALELYREGNIPEAKTKAQAAYFEVFENLEGPIRINISASKNFLLEEEFVGIRKMIKNGESADAVEQRIDALMAELRETVVELEGGYTLVAEKTEAVDVAQEMPLEDVEAVWLQAFQDIKGKLHEAVGAYGDGNGDRARELVLDAQFDGYKNSLLETAVRRYVSQGRDYENNTGFSEIIGLMRDGEDLSKVESGVSGLLAGLRADLPGLPLVEGVVSERVAQRKMQEVPDRDWSKVSENLFAEIEKAIALYEDDPKKAAALVQDSYFDVFEESGMEAKIGMMDAGFKAKLESHFSMMVGQMKKGAEEPEIRETMTVMRADFQKAVAKLAEEADTPMALFFYSLMIILREGFEAILIITAIIAYLIKTGHRDKLRVIYNGCAAALVLSVITAVLVKWVFRTSAASQEILEGATMLLATVVLFSVSYWLISKAEAQKWVAYIKGKVSSSLSSGSLKALWFAAFLAVYREGAETVLFYQALGSGADTLGVTAILGGFVLGCALLVVLYLVMRYGSVKLPLRPFFIGTGALLYYMAFVFAGKGMMEFVEGKLFEPSLVSWVPTIPFMGVYPYWQTLVPQAALVMAALAGFALMMKQKASVQEAS